MPKKPKKPLAYARTGVLTMDAENWFQTLIT